MRDAVLYIDDEPINLDGFETSFWYNYDVKTALSAAEGEKILQKTEIKVIISDQKMPDESGLHFFKRIRAQFPDTIFIILTGYADLDLTIEALNTGIIYQFLSKPWKKDELTRVIINGIQAYNLKKQNRTLVLDLEASNKKQEQTNNQLVKAGEALKKSEEKYVQLFQSIGEGIGIVDENEIFKFCNRTAEQIFEVEYGTLPGRSLHEFIDKNSLTIIENETLKRKKNIESSYRIKITTKKGREKYLQITATPKTNAQGVFNGTFGIFRDISDLLLAEKALLESEAKFKAYIENAPFAISVTNLNGEIIDVNRKACEMLGYSKNEILKKKANEIDPIFPSKEKIKELWKQLGKSQIIDFETFNHKKDGSSFPVQNSVVAIHQNGIPLFLLFTQDITERKLYENKIIESENRFRTVFQNEKIAKLLIDPLNGNIVDANKTAMDFYGYDYDELLSMNIEELHLNSDDATINDFKTGSKANSSYKFKHKLKGGQIRDVEVLITPLEINKKQLLLSSINNITAKVKAEKAMRESEEKFRIFFNQSADAIFIADLEEGKIVDMNTTALKWTGLKRSEIVGIPQKKLYPQHLQKQADAQFKNHYYRLLNGETIKPFYSEIISKNRANIPIEISPSLITLNNKKYLMGIFRDVSMRIKNEQKLKENEEKLLKAQQIAKLGYWQYYFETDTLEWSENTFKIFDVSKKEFTGDINALYHIVHPEDVAKVKKQIKDSIKSRNEYSIIHRIITRNGTIKFISERADIFYDEKNNPLTAMGIAQDVTDQRMAQHKLTESEKLLNSMFENAPFTLALLNEKHEITKVNKKPHELIHQNFPFHTCTKVGYVINCIGIETGVGTSEVCENCEIKKAYTYTFKTKKPLVQKEAEVITFDKLGKNNKTYLISTNYIEYNNKPHVLLTMLDISDRKEMEEDLLISKEKALYNERQYQMLSDLSFEGIVLLKKNRIIDVNKSFCQLTNHNKNYLIGLDLLNGFFLRKYHVLIKTKMELLNSDPFEVMVTRKDGEQIPVEMEIRKLKQRSGNILVISVRNITEQKELSNKVLKATIEAEEKERERYAQELHDGLGPLLSNVQMYYQWLAEEEENVSYVFEKGMKSLKSAFETLREISNNLSPHMLRNFGLSKAIKNFIENLAKTETLFEFRNNLNDARFNETIEVALYRVVIELINNSLKYAEASNIYLSAWCNDEFIMLEFRDNGKGFILEEAIKNHTGFGLRNMESRIKTLKGEILFNVKPGEGLTVYINVPITEVQV